MTQRISRAVGAADAPKGGGIQEVLTSFLASRLPEHEPLHMTNTQAAHGDMNVHTVYRDAEASAGKLQNMKKIAQKKV